MQVICLGRNLYEMSTVLRGSHDIMNSVSKFQAKKFKSYSENGSMSAGALKHNGSFG